MTFFLGIWRAILNIFNHSKNTGGQLPAPDITYPDGKELPVEGETQELHLAIIVGHEANAQGAQMYGSNKSEYVYNSRVAKLIEDIAAKSFSYIKVKTIFRDGIGISGAYKYANDVFKADICIELHFNAYNGSVIGTETLCSTLPNDIEFAHIVQKQMCAVFDRSGKGNRGVKAIARNARGGQSVHAFPGGANCLVEPFFGDNKEEALLAEKYVGAYAESLLIAVDLYARKMDLIK